MVDECILCRISNKEEPSEVVLESDNYLGFYNQFSRHKRDVLVIPKKHIKRLENIRHIEEFFKFVNQVHDILQSEFDPEATRVQINNGKEAGQSINHIHCHIIQYHKIR